VSSLRQTTSGIYFDHDGNGFAERTGWVAPNDVLLVHDLDRNGRIETGAELFGNNTLLPNGMKAFGGFEALRQFDSNQDGRITALDSSWQELQAWRDGNGNAKVDEGELLSLDTAGIAVLNLSYINGFQEDEQGNKHSQLGSYQSVDGLSHAMNDVWFSVDLARTEQRELMPVPEALQQLPDLPGFGNVASLHQVMAAEPSGQLPGLIRQWMVASSADRTQLMESIIVHWTGVQDYQLVYPLWEELTERRRLAALENLIGRTFRDGWPDPVPGFRAYVPIEQAFDNLSNLLEDQLIAQVDALPLLRAVSGSTTTIEGTNSSDFEPVVEILRNQLDGNPDMARLVKTGRVLERLGADGLALVESMAERSKSESGMFGLQLQAFSSIDACSLGTGQDDPIIGSSLNEWIEGRSGSDSLAGGDGNDILIGGAGDDLLAGDRGNDIYVFSSGDGVDTLFENDSTPGNLDEVRFTNVTSADVRELERDFNNLLMHYGITDQLTLQNHFAGEAYRIEQFRFQDGVLWGQAELEQRLLPSLAAAVA
jgi:Ca2+-binding RTX toxin-like protein